MNEKYAKKIFDKYNPKEDVVRCPYGRAKVRKLLDSYTTAAVNLYGILRREDLVEIFNELSSEKTTVEEMYILLLPLILRKRLYCFYKDYVVHYWAMDDFDQADYLLSHQADKPRYVPDKNEFLKYIDEEYVDNDYWGEVLRFMLNISEPSLDILLAYYELKEYITYNDRVSGLGPIFDEYDIVFDTEEQAQELFDLVFFAKNNTRVWENNGYSPSELHEMMNEKNKNIIKFPIVQNVKVGRNDPCPCGSGKKYKKCCGSVANQKIGRLSRKECKEFYETWFGLMGYVNRKKNVIKEQIEPIYPNQVSDVKIYQVREVLWENPELIDEYIKETKLSNDRVKILKLWREKHIKGLFLFLEYQPEYAIALALNEQNDNTVFGIKGISNTVANTIGRNLPIQAEAVLIPFKGHIIFDSFINSYSISYGGGAKASFKVWYDEAIKKGIITSLE